MHTHSALKGKERVQYHSPVDGFFGSACVCTLLHSMFSTAHFSFGGLLFHLMKCQPLKFTCNHSNSLAWNTNSITKRGGGGARKRRQYRGFLRVNSAQARRQKASLLFLGCFFVCLHVEMWRREEKQWGWKALSLIVQIPWWQNHFYPI